MKRFDFNITVYGLSDCKSSINMHISGKSPFAFFLACLKVQNRLIHVINEELLCKTAELEVLKSSQK